MRNNQSSTVEQYIIITIDILCKLVTITILSPLLIVTYIVNTFWRKTMDINDICFYKTINNERITVAVVELIDSNKVKVLIKGTYNYKTMDKRDLNIVSL